MFQEKREDFSKTETSNSFKQPYQEPPIADVFNVERVEKISTQFCYWVKLLTGALLMVRIMGQFWPKKNLI